MMKDDISIRVTFSEKGEAIAKEIMDFIEKNYSNISFQRARTGNNPKYKKGGTNYDATQGEFKLSYSRCNIKKGVPLLPVKTTTKKAK